MALSDTDVRELYAANGVTTSFAIPHALVSDLDGSDEVEVYTVDESTDPATEVLKVITTDYTLTGSPVATHVLFNTAPATPLKILIQRKIALTQPTNLSENSAIPMETIETALDRIMAAVQLLDLKIKRTLKVRTTIPAAQLDMTLPDPQAGYFLRWNTDEDALENVEVTGNLQADAPEFVYNASYNILANQIFN